MFSPSSGRSHHRPEVGRALWRLPLHYDFEAVPLIKGNSPRVEGFEVAGDPFRISPFEGWSHQRATNALTLARRVYAQELEVPVLRLGIPLLQAFQGSQTPHEPDKRHPPDPEGRQDDPGAYHVRKSYREIPRGEPHGDAIHRTFRGMKLA